MKKMYKNTSPEQLTLQNIQLQITLIEKKLFAPFVDL